MECFEMLNVSEATGEPGAQEYSLELVLGLSPPLGLWAHVLCCPKRTFYSSAIIRAASFLDFWPVLFPLYKCDFSEVNFKHYSSLFFICTITFK